MNEPKLCPMKFSKSIRTKILDKDGNIIIVECGACNKEVCAWWNEERSCCGVVAGR